MESEQFQSVFINPATASDISLDESQQLSSLYFDKASTFASLGLDHRIAKAVTKLKYIYPSLVQSKTIPYILSGRDVLVRARTGTGKTAAYILPILNKCLPFLDEQITLPTMNIYNATKPSTTTTSSSTTNSNSSTFCVILVPTRELVDQVGASLKQFSINIPQLRWATLNAEQKNVKQVQYELQQLQLSPHFIIATPTRLLHYLKSTPNNDTNTKKVPKSQLQQQQQVKLILNESLKFLVLDEADLLLSYGYDQDIRDCTTYFPKHIQTILMSATLTPELDGLRAIATHNPAIIKLQDDLHKSTLHQFQCTVLPHDKFLALYSHFVQGMYTKKTIIFVNDIMTAFKLQIFLNRFGINTVVLNDDLPYNSRKNIILQFNKGIFNYLIATDLSNNEIHLEKDSSLDNLVSLTIDDDDANNNTTKTDDAKDIKNEKGGKKSTKEGKNNKTKATMNDNDEIKDEIIIDSDDDDEDGNEVVNKDEVLDSMKSMKLKLRELQTTAEAEGDEQDEDDDDDEDIEFDEDMEFDEDDEFDDEDDEFDDEDDEDDEEEIKKEQDEEVDPYSLVKLEEPVKNDDGDEDDVKKPIKTTKQETNLLKTELELQPTSYRRSNNNSSKKHATSTASRGLDFQNVHTVVNFDLPTNFRSYTHRIGRTARAGKTGVAVTYLSFNPAKAQKQQQTGEEYIDEVSQFEQMNIQRSISEGREILSATEQTIIPLHVDQNLLLNLRVRVDAVLSKITTGTIRSRRLGAIRHELLNSERLQKHWEQHPNEVMLLKHTRALSKVAGINPDVRKQQRKARYRKNVRENKFLPDYLQTNMLDLPQSMRDAANKRRIERAQFYAKRARQRAEKKEQDPLRQKTTTTRDKKGTKGRLIKKGDKKGEKSKGFVQDDKKSDNNEGRVRRSNRKDRVAKHKEKKAKEEKKVNAANKGVKRQKRADKKTDHRAHLG